MNEPLNLPNVLESSDELTRINTEARQTNKNKIWKTHCLLLHPAESRRLRNIHPNELSSERPRTTRKYYVPSVEVTWHEPYTVR